MASEDEPCGILLGYELGDVHCSGEDDDGEESQTHREFVADHLGTASHGADEGILIVGRPTGEEDTEDSDR